MGLNQCHKPRLCIINLCPHFASLRFLILTLYYFYIYIVFSIHCTSEIPQDPLNLSVIEINVQCGGLVSSWLRRACWCCPLLGSWSQSQLGQLGLGATGSWGSWALRKISKTHILLKYS